MSLLRPMPADTASPAPLDRAADRPASHATDFAAILEQRAARDRGRTPTPTPTQARAERPDARAADAGGAPARPSGDPAALGDPILCTPLVALPATPVDPPPPPTAPAAGRSDPDGDATLTVDAPNSDAARSDGNATLLAAAGAGVSAAPSGPAAATAPASSPSAATTTAARQAIAPREGPIAGGGVPGPPTTDGEPLPTPQSAAPLPAGSGPAPATAAQVTGDATAPAAPAREVTPAATPLTRPGELGAQVVAGDLRAAAGAGQAVPADASASPPTVSTPTAALTPVIPPASAPGPLVAPPIVAPGAAVPLHRAAETVGQLLQVAEARGVTRARVALRPVELGGIEIRLQTSSAGVTAQVIADSPEATRLLHQAAGDLRRTLENAGVTLLALDVSTTGEDRSAASAAGFEAHAQARRDHAASSLLPTASPDPQPDLAPASPSLELPNGTLVDVLA